jgi:hypothetical protein
VASRLLDPHEDGFGAYDAKLWKTVRHWANARPRGVVIPDIRFPNEIAAVRAKGGRVWKTSHGHGLTGAAGEHASEAFIDEIEADHTFSSGLTLEQLPYYIGRLLEAYK